MLDHLNPVMSRRLFAAAVLGAAAMLSGCSTVPSASTSLEPNEGLVVVRLVNLGTVPLVGMQVSQVGDSSKTNRLGSIHYGQMQTTTIFGRLPAGQYQPKELSGTNGAVTRTVPIRTLTGTFEVQPGRITDLGTMTFVPYVAPTSQDASGEVSGSIGRSSLGFLLPLDPTPMPVIPLLEARYPELSKSLKAGPVLGWTAGTGPKQPAGAMRVAQLTSGPVSSPVALDSTHTLGGGALGTVGVQSLDGDGPVIWPTGGVHHIEAVTVLKDGRWLAGGEEGWVAVSDDRGARWQRLAGPLADEVVIHLSEAPDGTLHLVTMSDRGSTVYASASRPVVWKAIRHIPAKREFVKTLAGVIYVDGAATTRERLVIHTRPDILTTLDYRTGQWETQQAPRPFNHGVIATPDGYLVGISSSGWIYGSLDYGKTWNRLEAWVNMSMPSFIDRNRGFMVASDVSLSGFVYKLRRTEDGGKTWKTGEPSGGTWAWLQPFWTNADGTVLYTSRHGRIESSTDLGRTWR